MTDCTLDELVKAVRAGRTITFDMTGSMAAALACHGAKPQASCGYITGNFSLDYDAGADPVVSGTLNMPIGKS